MRILLTGLAMLALVAGVSPRGSVSGADEPITLVFLTWKSSGSGGWNRLLKEFHEKNPRIRIKTQVAPHSSTQYHAIITQRLKNQDPSVDVFLMDVVWPPEFGNAGWAMDLTSRFPPREQAKFMEGPIRANTWQGRIYGIPCYLGAGLFYYRKDLLDKYHFHVPRTWDEMLTQGEAIIKGENDPELYAYSGQFKQYEGLVCDMLEFLWSNGGAVMDSETGRVVLDKNAAIGAVAFVRDKIIGKAAPRGAVNYEEPESLGLFVQGKAVFHRNWPYAWAVANNPDKSRIAGRVGVAALPAFRGHHSASALGGWQFGINRYSRHPEEAWRFIHFMSSFRSQKILALEAGLAPTRKNVYQDPEIRARMPHLKAFLPAFKEARPRPLSPVYPMISQELQRFFSRAIVEKDSDLPEMATATSARIEKLLQLASMIKK